jgi:hypothetical protein
MLNTIVIANKKIILIISSNESCMYEDPLLNLIITFHRFVVDAF